jgi:hypothetical protein
VRLINNWFEAVYGSAACAFICCCSTIQHRFANREHAGGNSEHKKVSTWQGMIWEAKDCEVGSAGRARHSEFSIEASLSSSSLLMQIISGAHKSQSLSKSNPRTLANSLFSAA